MKKLYVLVGVPASGKSTWVKKQEWAKDCVVVSTDEFVEEWAQKCGKTYSEVFVEYMPTAVTLMADKVIRAREDDKNIIWDQTSTTVKTRAKKFNMLPEYYYIAVVFKTPEHKELYRRLLSRPGKDIPDHVIASMIAQWEEPTLEEGFNEIWYAE